MATQTESPQTVPTKPADQNVKPVKRINNSHPNPNFGGKRKKKIQRTYRCWTLVVAKRSPASHKRTKSASETSLIPQHIHLRHQSVHVRQQYKKSGTSHPKVWVLVFCYYMQWLIKILHLRTKNMHCIHGIQGVQTLALFFFLFLNSACECRLLPLRHCPE